MNETISVIIPAYNAGGYLRQCLDSVLAQTWKELEILVVDDASTDDTPQIITSYARRDPRIRYILKDVNEGVSLARNDALKLARGTHLLFVDGDDWIDPETCRRAMEAARAHNADVVLWSYVREVGTESRPKQIFDSDLVFDEKVVCENLYRRMVGASGKELAQPENSESLSTVWGKLYRRELVETNQIRFFDIRKIGTCEDLLFNLDVFRHARKAVFLNEHFYHYRRSIDSSVSTVYKPQLWQQWQTLFGLIRRHLDENGLEPLFYDALSNRIALSLFLLGINEAERKDGHRASIRGVKRILSDPVYREAIQKLDFRYFPLHWKVFFGFARMNWATGVYLLLLVIQKIRGR